MPRVDKVQAAPHSAPPSQSVSDPAPTSHAPATGEVAASAPPDLVQQLATLSQRVELIEARLALDDAGMARMLRFVAELAGRMFCIEQALHLRESGRLDLDGLSYVAPTSRATCELMMQRTLAMLTS